MFRRWSIISGGCSTRSVSLSCAEGLWTDTGGLFSHAARHYEKVLEIAEKRAGEALRPQGSYPLPVELVGRRS